MSVWNAKERGVGGRFPKTPWRSQRHLSGREPDGRPAAPLGAVQQSISLDDLSENPQEPANARILECETIASYNWMDRAGSSMIVPGMPAKWTPLAVPQKLNEDSGIFYRDRNAARYPDHPLEPAVEAILRMNKNSPKTKTADPIDVFGCASTLGNLLRFVNRDAEPFRILVEVVGRTVHFVRREKSPMDTIPDVRGYGHTFPEVYTTWESAVRGSASHQRVVRYLFGGFKCLCLFEGDGYLPDKMGNIEPVDTSFKMEHDGSHTSLEALASSLAVSLAASPRFGGALETSTAGVSIPQEAVFELKTRSSRRKLDQDAVIASQMPRLWLRHISNFILAYHSSGTFDDIKVLDVRTNLQAWERENEKHLLKFATLLQRIVDLARGQPNGKMEITFSAGDECLHIRDQMPDVPSLLSNDAGKRWRVWLTNRAVDEDKEFEHDEEEVGVGSYCDTNGDLTRGDDFFEEYIAEARDYTACDAECVYCGRCRY